MHLQVRLKHAGCSAFSKQQQHRQVGPTSQCDSNTTWPWQWSADSPELKPEHTQHLESDQAGCLSLTITLLSGLAECSSGVAASGGNTAVPVQVWRNPCQPTLFVGPPTAYNVRAALAYYVHALCGCP